jgi:cupin 2 domain-containing protein
MQPQPQNIRTPLATPSVAEVFHTLLAGNRFELERIVSTGQSTPAGEWYDQDHDEWVLLLSGEARLLFEGQPSACELRPGDYVNIPAHARHRVEWTDPVAETVWLALHYSLTPGLENRSPAPS